MKKIKVLILTLCLILLSTFTVLVVNGLTSNKVEGSKGLTYHLSDDGTFYIVSDYNFGLSDPNLVIPEEYNGLPVKEIANEAFAEKKWLRSVYIPKSIVKIGHGAFSQTCLETVYFNAENCQDFDSRNWVFYPDDTGKANINVVIGKDVKRIPSRLFYPLDTIPSLNPNVVSITFEEGSIVSSIGDYAFYNLSNVDSLEIPSSVKKIGKYAFYGNGFETIKFNEGLEEINEHAFDTSKNVKNITLPNSIKSVGKAAFRNALLLESISSKSTNYTTLEVDTFKYCTNLVNVDLDNITNIKESAFEACKSLESFDMPNVKVLGDYAFSGCTGLTKIVLDEKLLSIGTGTFENCTKVNEIIYKASNLNDLKPANLAFYNCGSETEGIKVTVTGDVTKVAKRLFLSTSNTGNLAKINEIIIDCKTLTLIDDYAFGYIDATVTYVGTKTMWSNVKVNIGNNCFETVMCVKTLEVE